MSRAVYLLLGMAVVAIGVVVWWGFPVKDGPDVVVSHDRAPVLRDTVTPKEVLEAVPAPQHTVPEMITGKPPLRLFQVGSISQKRGDHLIAVWQPELVVNVGIGFVVESLRVMLEGRDLSERFQRALLDSGQKRLGIISMPELALPDHYPMTFSFSTLPESEWGGVRYHYELEVERLAQTPPDQPLPIFRGFPSSPPAPPASVHPSQSRAGY